MSQYKFLIATALGVSLLVASCTKDLNRKPITDVTSASVYSDPAQIKGVLAKCYAGLSLSGQSTDGNNDDIKSNDAGTTVYFRNYWTSNELTTDEAVIAWADGDLPTEHTMTWTPSNDKLQYWYARIMYEVGLCNEFLRQTTDDKMSANGITGKDLTDVHAYRTEVRFLRALAYLHGIDAYGNLPLVTETDPVGSFVPKQTLRKDLFTYVEGELKSVADILPAPRANELGRADQGCAWMALSKLYLNAQIYIGAAHYADCITYCNKIISSGAYNLSTSYANLFKTDNLTTSHEVIFPLMASGLNAQSYGNSTFIIHAMIGGSMTATDWGVASGWGGLRVTKNLVQLFSDPTGATDKRAMFYTNGQNLDINNISTFTDGYAVSKFSNLSSTGATGTDPSGNFCDLAFPMYRYADVLLMYAEASLRGGGGDATTALSYINMLRDRAYGDASGEIGAGDLNLNFIIAERGRELYWEGHRRTDLIRFGMFTGSNYVWPWKGGAKDGSGVGDYRVLFPIPSGELSLNSTLVQNPGY